MAIKQLTEEQIRTWTLEQKDKWWLENVYRGDMPQLTLRSAIFGMMIGGVLSITNLYVGAKTGWTLGVGITSVILAFGFFRVANKLGLANEFTVLENNAMQSIATSAGYVTSALAASLAAYMMITNSVVPMVLTFVWIFLLGCLGVFFAFPLKRRFINEEQYPFPEGKAAGIVMDALHTGDSKQGMFKAMILLVTSITAAIAKVMQSEVIMAKLKTPFLMIPEYMDGWLYKIWDAKIAGVSLKELTLRPDTDFVLMAAGGLMGIHVGVSLLVGALINYAILAPWAINHGDVVPKMVEGVAHYGFKPITMWALWGGVAMMTTSSLYSFVSKPKLIIDSLKSFFSKKKPESQSNILKNIELPISASIIGILISGTAIVAVAHIYFNMAIWIAIIAIPLVFICTLIGTHSTAITSITPLSALGKITQLTFGALSPGNITTNIMTASISAEVAGNAANLLMDIKPGYMLGAKPRQQAVGHILGVIAGSLISIPVFYFVFLRGNPAGLSNDQYPFPSAIVWKAVAEVLTTGLSNLRESARWAVLFGAILGIAFEWLRIRTHGRFWLSAVAMGLATVIPFPTCFAMFLGSFIFWTFEKLVKNKQSLNYRVMVENLEPVCAGVIAGGAIMGIVVVILETFVLV
jgi:OPT family oligopeptide transporter